MVWCVGSGGGGGRAEQKARRSARENQRLINRTASAERDVNAI